EGPVQLRNLPGLRIQLDQHPTSAAEPCIAFPVESPARRAGNQCGCLQFPQLIGLGVQKPDQISSCDASCPVSSVHADDIVVRAANSLQRPVLHDFSCLAINPND